MAKIIMESWRDGMEKVALTKLQMELLKTSLKVSKNNVDSLLNGEIVVFEIDDADLAKKFIDAVEKIGVNCKLMI